MKSEKYKKQKITFMLGGKEVVVGPNAVSRRGSSSPQKNMEALIEIAKYQIFKPIDPELSECEPAYL